MFHRFHASALLLCVLFSACIRVETTQEPAPSSQEFSSSAPAVESELEAPGTATESIDPVVIGTGALSERMLPQGILEIGYSDAPLTLLVVTEHHCRYCNEFLIQQMPRLHADFLETHRLKLNIMVLPLQKYTNSDEAAAALLCAAQQGKGLGMHQHLFEGATPSAYAGYAKDLKLDTKAFAACRTSDETKTTLAAQAAWLQSLDVTLVPTFFLNGEKFVGLPYYPDLEGRIWEAINMERAG